jgi:c-di-GMP-related signal transduction protein
MKQLRLNIKERDDFDEDLINLQNQLKKKGYSASIEDISFAWACFSSSKCAQWLRLSDNEDENIEDILEYFKEVE